MCHKLGDRIQAIVEMLNELYLTKICYFTVCYTSLRKHSDLQVPDIDNKTSYCMQNSEVVNVTFTKHVIVSGILLQGNSEKNGWITKFSLSYQKSKDQNPWTKINPVSSLCNLCSLCSLCNLIFIGYGIFSNDF